ncbi:CoA-binding protein [Rhodobacteraceae bacterium NNCM2]|nr:CoA-binding protein [Coraliihabitans acroporae]
MGLPDYSDAHLRDILSRTKSIAMVGVSMNTIRPSYIVARYLNSRKFRLVPVNPVYEGKELFGTGISPSLSAIGAEHDPIHMVDIFRRSEEAGAIVDEALDTLLDRGLQTIWMQIGVFDKKAAKRAEKAGVTVIMNRCPKIEYQRLWGELGWGGFNTGIITSKLR